MTPESVLPAEEIEYAARALCEGRLVAFPTETVYGLGADAHNPAAVASMFRIKGRPADHPVIVHLASGSDPGAWVGPMSASAERLMQRLTEAFWPGPLTLIVPRAARVLDAVTGGQDSVGLRCPDHRVAQALLKAFGETRRTGVRSNTSLPSGIAAPSANRFGHISPTTAEHVRAEFGAEVEVLDGGACRVGIESTILDLSRADTLGPVLLRPGGVTAARLAEILGAAPRAHDASAPRASGMLAAHYAPRAPMRLVDREMLAGMSQKDLREIAVLAFSTAPQRASTWCTALRDAEIYARELYAALRALDSTGAREIWVEAPPQTSEWAAILDRLVRAETKLE